MVKTITTNLLIYPHADPALLGLRDDTSIRQEITLSDWSGNILLLMWVMMTAGMVKLSKDNYEALAKLQQDLRQQHEQALRPAKFSRPNKPTFEINTDALSGLTPQQEKIFEAIMSSMTFIDKNILFRSNGDEICERLGNDNHTIDSIHRVTQSKHIPVRIMASNHLHMFVEHFLSYTKNEEDDDEDEDLLADLRINGQGVSLLHLFKSIETGAVQRRHVLEKIEAVYPKRLMLIDYTIHSDTNTTIYAHAPFDLQSILDVAQVFKMPIPDVFNNTQELAVFIDKIDEHFEEIYVKPYFTLHDEKPELSKIAQTFSADNNPIGALFWLKDFSKVNRPVPPQFRKLTTTLLHGHTDQEKNPVMTNRFSLNFPVQNDNAYTFPIAVAISQPKPQAQKTVVQKLVFQYEQHTNPSNHSPVNSSPTNGK